MWQRVGGGGAATLAALAAAAHRRRRQGSVRGDGPGPPPFDVAVVGGGLVGLAVAREAAARGRAVVLLEREGAIAACASGGNTGLGHTGYDAPVGSLERRLLRRAIALHPALYRAFGLDLRHVRKCGSLVVAWTPEQLDRLDGVLRENLEAGDSDARRVEPAELRDLEPALSPAALGAVVCPNEAVVEPWLVPVGFAESALRHGVDLRLSTEVVSARRGGDGLWVLRTGRRQGQQLARSEPGQIYVRPVGEDGPAPAETDAVTARTVVNCAGLHGDRLEALRLAGLGGGSGGDRDGRAATPFTVTPRKGQFVVFDGAVDLHNIIETVPTQYTKGVIVWSTVYGNVVVGPTATDQASRTDRSTDPATVERLIAWAHQAVPALQTATVLGTYSGLRPATEFRDYCIEALPGQSWVTAGGIRSTGLTACSAIGEYVVDLLEQMDVDLLDPSDGVASMKAELLGVTEAKARPARPCVRVANGPLPTLAELAADYRASGDGTVGVYGRRWWVSHPLTSFGLESYTGEQSGVTS